MPSGIFCVIGGLFQRQPQRVARDFSLLGCIIAHGHEDVELVGPAELRLILFVERQTGKRDAQPEGVLSRHLVGRHSLGR